MGCKTSYYSGAGECDNVFQRLIGFIVMDKGVTLSDPTALATYTDIIAPTTDQTGIYLAIENGYQNNTAEPERATSNQGFNKKIDDPNIALIGMGNPSFCNYKTLWDMDGKDVEFVGITKDGGFFMTENSEGVSTGFRAEFSIHRNAPLADALNEYGKYYIDFKYMDQMNNAKVIQPDFGVIDLDAAQPVGLSASVAVAYAVGGDVTIQVDKRCTQIPFTVADATTNYEVLYAERGSTDVDIAITAVDATSASLGKYVVTIQRDSSGAPADLTSDIWIRVIEDDGTNLTYVSPPIRIRV